MKKLLSLLPDVIYLIFMIWAWRRNLKLTRERDSLLRTCDGWKETNRKQLLLIDAQYAQLNGKSAEEVDAIMARIEDEDDKRHLN